MRQEINLTETALRELCRARALEEVKLVAHGAGFELVAVYAGGSHTLMSARGEPRVFANLNRATSFLMALGVCVFQVDASAYAPGLVRKARPDRAAALRGTRSALRQATLGFS